MQKQFDLNIEQVLEHWGLEHAVREIIANALDEQMLTDSRDIEIYQTMENIWHIRDYGRGLNYTHFTQNENPEKLDHPNLIGKFGVGLKDALAVFYRHNIKVEMFSKHGHITLTMHTKEGFDVETLHAVFAEAVDKSMVGTEIVMHGLTQADMAKAKAMFLMFSDAQKLETTMNGAVYTRDSAGGHIYVNGVRVASEENFMFTYNITNINAQIKKALNRERSNVGRTAYTTSVKGILKQCQSEAVLEVLVADLNEFTTGLAKDESSWVDISAYAVQTLNKKWEVIFIDSFGFDQLTNQEREILEESGKRLVVVPTNVLEKVGSTVTQFNDVMSDYTNSFSYDFVSYERLTIAEKNIYDSKRIVLQFLKKARPSSRKK